MRYAWVEKEDLEKSLSDISDRAYVGYVDGEIILDGPFTSKELVAILAQVAHYEGGKDA